MAGTKACADCFARCLFAESAQAHANASRAAKPYFGIGNPLLDGPDSRYASLAKQAREKQICTGNAPPKLAGFSSTRGAVGQLTNRNGSGGPCSRSGTDASPRDEGRAMRCGAPSQRGAENIHLGERGSEAD